jgi:F-type H+-transporting ATPase subunit gamma
VPSTIDIRRRIRSVKNTQQITKAMKVVSAAKLRRAQERMLAARPYASEIRKVLASLSTRVEMEAHPLLQEREEKKVLLLVITADKGLCGAFNTNILKASQAAIRDRGWSDLELLTIGKKGADFFKRRPVTIRHQAINVFQALSPEHAREIATMISDDFISGRFDAVYGVYNEFKSVMQQNLRVERILPLERAVPGENEVTVEYKFEPAPEKILSELLPRHVEFQIYRMLLESLAAEHGARMSAMEAASKNASEMIDSLTLSYNRIRQAAITKEIIEIVSGASALG